MFAPNGFCYPSGLSDVLSTKNITCLFYLCACPVESLLPDVFLYDLRNVWASSLGQVDWFAGQVTVTFKSSLAEWARVQGSHILTKSLTKMSKKWSQARKIKCDRCLPKGQAGT